VSDFYALNDSIPASSLRPGMHLHRVAQHPLSAVFAEPVDADVLAVEPFTQGGLSYVKVTLPAGSTLNLATNRPVQVKA
jgi:hypothetical protein